MRFKQIGQEEYHTLQSTDSFTIIEDELKSVEDNGFAKKSIKVRDSEEGEEKEVLFTAGQGKIIDKFSGRKGLKVTCYEYQSSFGTMCVGLKVTNPARDKIQEARAAEDFDKPKTFKGQFPSDIQKLVNFSVANKADFMNKYGPTEFFNEVTRLEEKGELQNQLTLKQRMAVYIEILTKIS